MKSKLKNIKAPNGRVFGSVAELVATMNPKVIAAYIELVEKDAARYEFLRDIDYTIPFKTERNVKVIVCDWAKTLDKSARTNVWSSTEIFGKRMDKEIDRAMRNKSKGAK